MTWRGLVERAYAAKGDGARARFAPGADRRRLDEVERELGAALAPDLRALLAESDGVLDVLELDGRLVPSTSLIWSCDAILSANRIDLVGSPNRAVPRNLIAFAGAGADGIVFAYVRAEPNGAIVAWYPIEDRCQPVASSLEEFLRGWTAGQIAV